MKNGTRLQSQVCDTQVIVVKNAASLDELRCGGVLMVSLDTVASDESRIDPTLAGGSLMGKRYVDQLGAELLVTRAGAGTLTTGGGPLNLKETKPLPASD